jgi:CubicO group peptidase (beta-lactamase class C family)
VKTYKLITYRLRIVTFIACCGFAINPNLVFADEEIQQLTTDEILAHPEVKGALSAIDAWLEGVQIYERIPGISVGIVHDQVLIWNKGYGYSNLETSRPADADTLYSICSISKLFTSIGIMQLRDANKLTLRDPVGDHLDWFSITQAYENSGPITIESLLTHTSGLPYEAGYPYWDGPDFPFPTRQRMIEGLKTQSTLYPAQRIFQYSNLAVSIAGEIVAARSGQSYKDYVKTNILDPLGLTSTRPYYPVEKRGEQLAIGYSGFHRDGKREPVNPFFTGGITPAAGFTSSVKDLGRFASWQFRLLEEAGSEVLDANTLREMHRVHWVDPDWGIGFIIQRIEDMTIVGHSGGCPGYTTNFQMATEEEIAVVVLTNASNSPAKRLTNNLLKTISPALKAAKTSPTDSVPDFSMYEGNFDARVWGGEVAIRQWGDQLVAITFPSDDLGEAMTRIKHEDGHTFVRLTDDGERREPWFFELGDDGRTQRVRQHDGYSTRIE